MAGAGRGGRGMHELTAWQLVVLAYFAGQLVTAFSMEMPRHEFGWSRRVVLWPGYWLYLTWKALRLWRGLPV